MRRGSSPWPRRRALVVACCSSLLLWDAPSDGENAASGGKVRRVSQSTWIVRKSGSLAPCRRAPTAFSERRYVDHVVGDPLARQQHGDARRVAGDRLGADAADRVVDGDHLRRAQERLARRASTTSFSNVPVASVTSSVSPGRSIRRDDRRQVVDEALELARQLVDAEHEHDRRLRGELDLGVEVRAQRGGHLVAGRAGAADVDHDPQRVAGGDAGPADLLVADDAAAGDLVDRRARCGGRRRSWRTAAPRRAARAGGARRRARASAARTATSSASAAACGRPRRGRSRPESRTCSSADCVSEPAILCTDVSIASAPSVQRARRQVVVEAEVRAPRLVDDQRHAGGVRDLRAARDVRRHPVVGGGDDERGARAGRGVAARPAATPA